MTDWGDKAREIHKRGMEERGDYSPRGFPLRVYNYWARTSGHAPRRENFCHYWRVVLIWGPLRFFFVNPAERALDAVADFAKTAVGVVTLLTAYAVVMLLLTVQGDGLWSLGLIVPYVMVGGVLTAVMMFDDEYGDLAFNTFTPLGKLGIVLLSPVMLLTFLLLSPVKYWNNTMHRIAMWIVITIGAAAALGALFLLGYAIYSGYLLDILLVLGAGAALLAVVLGIGYLAEMMTARNRMKRDEEAKRLEAMTFDERLDYLRSLEERPPSKMREFFTAVGDLFRLVFQAVRVWKWKFCPTVTIPETGGDE